MQAKLGLRYDSDRQISLAVCLQVFLVGIKNMLIQAFEGLYENNMLLNLILFAVAGVLYVVAYFSLGKRMASFTPLCLGMIAFVVISFAGSAMIHSYGLVRYAEILIFFLPFCFLTALC